MAEKKVAKKTKEPAQPVRPAVNITGCTFNGTQIKWDQQALDAVETVADGLLETAEGLNKLAGLFSEQKINIGPLLQIGEPEKEK